MSRSWQRHHGISVLFAIAAVVAWLPLHLIGEKVLPSVLIVEGLVVAFAGAALYSAYRKQAAAERRYQEIVEGVKAIAWEAEAKTLQPTFVSRQAEEMLGYPAERWLAERDLLTSIIHPEDRERVVRTRREAIGLEEGRSFEYRVLTPEGETRWIRDDMRVVRDDKGQVQGLRGLMLDITGRKRIEAALQKAEKKYRDIFEHAAEGIFQTGLDGTLLTANPALMRIFGYDSPHEILNGACQLYADPPRREELARLLQQHGSVTEFEVQGRRRDGSPLWLSVNARAIRDTAGEIAYFEGTCRDITETKRSEERLKHSLSILLALREAGQILGSTLQAGEIGRRLLKIMRGVSSLTTAIIDIEDEDGQLRIWQASGLDSLWPKARYAPEAEVARQAAKSAGEPRLFRLHRPGSEDGHLAGLCLPLRVRDRVIGVLEVYGPESLAENDTLEILSGLANQTASALENARLYGELAEREKRLENLIGKLFATQEEERQRVAFEIHDGLAQVAAATHQHLQAFTRFHAPQQNEAREVLDKTLKLAQQTAEEARQVIANLIPTLLDDFGLKAAIRSEVDSMRTEGWCVEYGGSLEDDTRLPVAVETALFRISQEALRNVRKHAHTDQVQVFLDRADETVRLYVRDWGRGFKRMSSSYDVGPGEKLGISSMKQRVNLLGGRLEINSRRGAGTAIVAEIPLPADSGKSPDRDLSNLEPGEASRTSAGSQTLSRASN